VKARSLALGAPELRRVDADWVVAGYIWALLLAVALPTHVDPDLWGHLRFGLDWLSTRTLSYEDPYSFTQDRPWINHEWLSEAAMAVAYRLLGVPGLVALKATLFMSGLVILSGALASLPVLIRSGGLLLATWSAVAPISLTVRPHLWSWLLTILLARVLMRDPSVQHLIGLPLLFALWMNLHGGIVIGLGLLGIWTAYHLRAGGRAGRWALAVATVSLAATLVNPYGPWMWEFLWETVRIGRNIREWRPIWTAELGAVVLPWAVATIAVAAGVLSGLRPRIDRLVVMLAVAYASARTLRLVPFFTVISLIYLVPSLRALTAGRWTAWKLSAPSPVAAALALVPLFVVGGVVTRSMWVASSGCVPIRGDWVPDLTVASALRASASAGRLVTSFAWGQYAIWHFGPSLRVSFDGRLETVYSEEADLLQYRIERGEPEGLEFLARVRPEYIWLSPASARIRQWLRRQPDYRLDLETPESFLGVRADLPRVISASGVPPACFPG
jgi:hypothetical protein